MGLKLPPRKSPNLGPNAYFSAKEGRGGGARYFVDMRRNAIAARPQVSGKAVPDLSFLVALLLRGVSSILSARKLFVVSS